jgi:DNA processing protein
MVTAADLRLSESDLNSILAPTMLPGESEDPVELFAALAWSVICEPGDGFAGQLVDTFGFATALGFELKKLPAKDYVSKFAEAGSDWVEMQAFGRFEKTLNDSRERWGARISLAAIRHAIDAASGVGAHFINQQSKHWPQRLNDLEKHKPRGLWLIGKPELLTRDAISFVGSRMASTYGEYSTGELVAPLVNGEFSVVSGGAYGVDAMAHRAALALEGDTVAVMAGGLDRLYPSGNADLFQKVAEKGCLVSEMPPGAEPTKWRFLQRNRLIAALGLATIVIEANPKSGAVSTANRALELGRPLGAVPGPINSPGSHGCHRLIRESSATLITSAEDILEMIGLAETGTQAELSGLGALETRVNDVIGHSGANMEKICHEGGLTRSEAQLGLSGLLLAGLVEHGPRGWHRMQ